VKVEVPEVKVEVKDEPPSPPHGQPPTSRSEEGEDRGDPTGTITVTTTAQALEGRVCRPSDVPVPRGRRVGRVQCRCLSAAASGIVVIDEDDADGVSADVKGKAPL
jgi:hypothetical protein